MRYGLSLMVGRAADQVTRTKPSARAFAAIIATVASSALFIAAPPSGASASDKDCADFGSQRAAQFFYIRHGGPRYDPDRLDADHDGVACEDNPCPCYYKKHLPRRAQLDVDRRRATA
jgi:excalibur calcium-binding domain-containing protein